MNKEETCFLQTQYLKASYKALKNVYYKSKIHREPSTAGSGENHDSYYDPMKGATSGGVFCFCFVSRLAVITAKCHDINW